MGTMLRNSSFTCNSKTHKVKKADDVNYPNIPHSESKVWEISQPIKIAQLLGACRQSQSAKKNSSIKPSQPERITPYLKNASTHKKNKINVVTRLHHSGRNVRRNLNFTQTPETKAKKSQKITSANQSYLRDDLATSKKSLHSSSRKSLLLPPNSIKDIHIRNRLKHSRSMLPHLTETYALSADSTDKYSKISEVIPKNCPPLAEEMIGLAVDRIWREESIKTSVIQYTSSRTFNAINQSGIESLHSSSSDLMNVNDEAARKQTTEHLKSDEFSNINVHSNQNSGPDVTSTDKRQQSSVVADTAVLITGGETHNRNCQKKLKSVTSPKNKCLSTSTNDSRDDLCVTLGAIKIPNESNVDLQHGTSEDHEYVTLSKQELKILSSRLKHLICKLEEDLSYMRLTLTSVSNLLSANSTANKTIGDSETRDKQQTTKNLHDNAQMVNNTSAKSVSRLKVTSAVNSENNSFPRDAYETLDLNALSEIDALEKKVVNFKIQPSRQVDTHISDSNKENKSIANTPINVKKRSEPKSETRRRSMRLMAKALKNSNAANDSFVNLEEELDITHERPGDVVSTIVSRKDCTSTINHCKDNKASGRPWKEYMALKSRMSCLLTPNAKRFNSTESQNTTYPEVSGAKASLSNKILAELHNLYADSPNPQ